MALYGNNSRTTRGAFTRNPDATVPNQSPLFPSQDPGFDDGLHTPCQNVPMVPPVGAVAQKPPSRSEWNPGGYRWGKASDGMFGRSPGSWSDSAYFDPTRPREMSLGFSREEVEYAKLSEKKNREIASSMTDRQKRLLDALSKGKLFRLSRLVPDKNPR